MCEYSCTFGFERAWLCWSMKPVIPRSASAQNSVDSGVALIARGPLFGPIATYAHDNQGTLVCLLPADLEVDAVGAQRRLHPPFMRSQGLPGCRIRLQRGVPGGLCRETPRSRESLFVRANDRIRSRGVEHRSGSENSRRAVTSRYVVGQLPKLAISILVLQRYTPPLLRGGIKANMARRWSNGPASQYRRAVFHSCYLRSPTSPQGDLDDERPPKAREKLHDHGGIGPP